jgi:hypothetical protein
VKEKRKIIGVVTLVVIVVIWFMVNTEFRSLPDDFVVTAEASTDNARVTDVLWYEFYSGEWFGLKKFPVYLWVEVIVENQSDKPIDLGRQTVVITHADGEQSKQHSTSHSGYSNPYLVLQSGESRPMWVYLIDYPDRFKSLDWKSIEIQIQMVNFTNNDRCIKHWGNVEIYDAGYQDNGNYQIVGHVGEYLPFEDFDDSIIFVSFYNEEGNFIGKRNIEIEEPRFVDTFNPEDQSTGKLPIPWYSGGFILGEISSYKVHYFEQIDRYNGCPDSN